MKKKYSSILFLLSLIPAFTWLFVSCDQAKLSDARGQYLRGEYHAASETYRKLYSKSSRKERSQRGVIAFEMAENYRRLNQPARAVTAYSNAIRYGYPDTLMYYHYARMLHREGKYEPAAEAYRHYLELQPDNMLALNGLRGVELAMQWRDNPTRYVVQRVELLNSNRAEFSPMLSPDGDVLYFTSSRDESLGDGKSPITGTKYNDIFRSYKNVNGEWKKPEHIDSGVNTDCDEGTPSISRNGEWMYYTYSCPDPVHPTATKIYLSGRNGDRWGEGRLLEIVKDDSVSLFAHPAISPSGRYLYFVSDMPGGYGGKDIWRAAMRGNNEVISVENLGPEINTAGDELFPYLRNDSTLYFSSDGHPGMGGLDIFMAEGPVDVVGVFRGTVFNLQSPLNSPADDFGITFVPGEEKGFLSSNRNDARGYDHIYSFAYPEAVARVEGLVVDQDEELITDAIVTVVGSDGSQLRLTTGKKGEYRFKATRGLDYLLMASAEGFLNQKQRLTTSPAEKDTLYYVDFIMIPYNKPVVLENIFYDFNSATLRPESKEELGALVALLNENPSVSIQLASHTDRKGSDEYNLDLSLRRAQSVVDWLTAQGIDARRMSAQGFGKTQPVKVTRKMAEQYDFLEEGDELTAEFIESLPIDQQEIADQINRRTSFEVMDDDFGLQ